MSRRLECKLGILRVAAVERAKKKYRPISHHAQDGSGNTAVGKSMKIPDLHSAEVQSQSDAQLAEVIGNGKNSMPPFKESLSSEQIHDLVTHVRQLSQKK